jgi:hypothetical protein
MKADRKNAIRPHQAENKAGGAKGASGFVGTRVDWREWNQKFRVDFQALVRKSIRLVKRDLPFLKNESSLPGTVCPIQARG